MVSDAQNEKFKASVVKTWTTSGFPGEWDFLLPQEGIRTGRTSHFN